MKLKMKLKMKLGFLFVAALSLTACADTNQTAPNESLESVSSEVIINSAIAETITTSITLQEEGKDLTDLSKELKIEEGQNLLAVMEENYDLTAKDGFISAIEGREQNEKEGKYWLYSINGEQATVGAADYIVKDKDVIVWNLDGM